MTEQEQELSEAILRRDCRMTTKPLDVLTGPEGIARIERGILFVVAEWSVPARAAFIRRTAVLDTIDLGAATVHAIDADRFSADAYIRCFGRVLHGAGETFWLRLGRVANALWYPSSDEDSLIARHTARLLEL